MLKKVLSIGLALMLVLGVFAALLAKPAEATEAVEITELSVSEELVELLQGMEGFIAIPKWDYGQWSVGFGSRCPDEDLERYQKEGIPPEEAHQLMLDHLAEFEKDVNAFMVRNQIQLNQYQFDAMVSFVYNVGAAVLRNNESDVIQAVLNGAEGNDFLYAWGQWSSAGGEFLLGLLRRRMMEAYIYLYGTYSIELPGSFCYVLYDTNGGQYDSRCQGYDSNLAAVPLSTPTREGYIFTGWYTAASGGEQVRVLDETTNGMTLYAHWEVGTQTPEIPLEESLQVTVIGNGVSVRQAAGSTANIVSHLYRGEKLMLTGLTEQNNTLWGLCSKGWVCLEYTDYYELTGTERPGHGIHHQQVQVPIKATVLSTSGVTVYSGPHTSYPQAGTLTEGKTILIEEVMTFCNLLWGRYTGGWVRLNQKILLHDDQMLAHSFTAEVTHYYLNVRSGPGTQYSSITQLNKGDTVEIFSVVIVDGDAWGRFVTGWIFLEGYTDFDVSKLDYYRSHSYGQWETVTEPTCDQPGQQRRLCAYCDQYELQQIEPTAHTMGQWYVSREGTCVKAGEERRDCENCDHYETRTASYGDHDMGQWYLVREATCTMAGEERQDCANCDHYETRETALGDHAFGQWQQIVAPGCETVGQEQRQCTACDHTESREVAATGHSFGQWMQIVAPGCETVGQEQRQCTACDHQETREVAAAGHSFGQWYETQAPTADAEGEARRDCENCQHYETKVLPADPHVFGQWYVVKEATCTTPGEERRDCSHCDQQESRPIAVKDHTLGDWIVISNGTCVTPGQEKRTCVDCDHFEVRDTVLGDHCFGQWTVFQAPGCETAGQERRTCIYCDHFESRETAPAGHSFGQWYQYQAPSCTMEGQERRDCTDCEHYELRTVDKIAHNYGAWNVTVVPTIDEEGLQTRHCVDCGHQQTEILPVLPAVERLFATITASSLNVRASASASSTKMGVLNNGLSVEILEQTTVSGKVWGRIEYGWIMLTGYATLETRRVADVEDTGDKTFAVITCNYLSIRPTASTSGARLATIQTGARVRIYEIQVVGSTSWGRTALGWIMLTGYTELEIEPGLHTEHTYGDWYVADPGNCVTPAQERRDCTGCDHYQIRDGQLGDHVFGTWTVTVQPTCAQPGQERRNCQFCDHFQVRDTDRSDAHVYGDWYLSVAPGCETTGLQCRDCANCDHFQTKEVAAVGHSLGDWYLSVAPTCENEGLQCRDCMNCDHFESKIVAALGHKFGAWYVAKEATTQEAGQERRDCATCGQYEVKEIPKLPMFTEPLYGWFTGTGYLSVRAGAGTGYDRVDKLYPNEKVQIHETVDVNGTLWGRIDNGWVCITGYMEVAFESELKHMVTQLYATVTYSYLTIRSSAGSGYDKLGTLDQGDVVPIYEIVVVSGKNWGHTDAGWICLSGYTALFTEEKSVFEGQTTRIYATVTYSYLTLRSGASSNYDKLGTLDQGDVVEILEIVPVGNKDWGRTENGWICLTGYTILSAVQE